MSLPNLSADPWTHIVLAIGTNDTKNFHSVPRFKKEFGGLLYALRAKWPEARVVWSPVHGVHPRAGDAVAARQDPGNPRRRDQPHGRAALPRARRGAGDPAADHRPEAGFSTDGFHASEAGYRAWAEHLLGLVIGERSA